MIRNYKDFQIDLLLESLILESKIQFSEKFIKLIGQIKNNRVSDELSNLLKTGVDAEFTQNYIDIGNLKDELIFTPERKAKEILGSEVTDPKYKVTQSDRYLTHARQNDYIYNELGYTKPDGDPWAPSVGTIGTIKGEAKSNRSDNIYCWFISDSGQQTVINKRALTLIDERLLKVWSSNRTPIKIGRLVRAILTSAGVSVTDKEIEDFVNSYKSAFDIMSDALLRFDLVKGEKISYWYNMERYDDPRSTLGNSCMAEVPASYFNIYCKNTNCSLLILYSDKGNIKDGKYVSDKIKGRALVWNTQQGDVFMDRIYTNWDSDVDLFKSYAQKNGWWYKQYQQTSSSFSVSNGTTSKKPVYTINLDESNFRHYPYLDSLIYLNSDSNLLSNLASEIDANYELQSTIGSRCEL